MTTKTHDEMIDQSCRWAESLGYKVVESHKATETGADAVFQNCFGEQVLLEVVTGANFRDLLKKERIMKALKGGFHSRALSCW